MYRLIIKAITLMLAHACCTLMANANPLDAIKGDPLQTISSADPSLLTPPKGKGPVVVQPHFELYSLNLIDDELETFEFTGILTLKWHDPRQAFDPLSTGINEKVFQGEYQVKELWPGWYPGVTLANRSGLYQKEGMVLRIQPDGTSTLMETLNASARTKLNMVRFPFDKQHLEAVFEVLGLNSHEFLLQVASDTNTSILNKAKVPQWIIMGSDESVRKRSVSDVGRQGVTSEFVVSFDVKRDSFYFQRLVIFPLIIIVLLSFSVFWMDRSSIGDRLNVSFIGILTAVSYQILISDQMPSISYFTFMNGFLTLSFFVMSATVIISLFVSSLDQQRKNDIADQVDLRSRWVFPLAYFVMLFLLGWSTMML